MLDLEYVQLNVPKVLGLFNKVGLGQIRVGSLPFPPLSFPSLPDLAPIRDALARAS